MRQGSNAKRLRGRTGRKNLNPRSQNFESNGPEVKVRGNAQQVVEKYLALARDASSAGDRITAESYFQHAEHYYRLMTANGGYDDRMGHGNRPNGDYAIRPDGSDMVEEAVVEAVTNGRMPHPKASENGVAAAPPDGPSEEPGTPE